jgi:hypothetical protein
VYQNIGLRLEDGGSNFQQSVRVRLQNYTLSPSPKKPFPDLDPLTKLGNPKLHKFVDEEYGRKGRERWTICVFLKDRPGLPNEEENHG